MWTFILTLMLFLFSSAWSSPAHCRQGQTAAASLFAAAGHLTQMHDGSSTAGLHPVHNNSRGSAASNLQAKFQWQLPTNDIEVQHSWGQCWTGHGCCDPSLTTAWQVRSCGGKLCRTANGCNWWEGGVSDCSKYPCRAGAAAAAYLAHLGRDTQDSRAPPGSRR